MNLSNLYRTGRHCVFDLHAHLVFVAKYRKEIFTKRVLQELKPILDKVCFDFEAKLLELNGEFDHIHLLLRYPPKVALSKLVNSLKGVSARLLRKKGFNEIEKALWGKSLWSPSYFVSSCGGAPLDRVKEYIQQQ